MAASLAACGGESSSDANQGSGTYRVKVTDAGSEGAALKSCEQKGTARCEPLGERNVGRDAAVGYRIRNNAKGDAPDPTAIHMWISRATGLPLYHGLGDDGGLRWVYGPEVVAPPGSEEPASRG